jgi:hypothetical protein
MIKITTKITNNIYIILISTKMKIYDKIILKIVMLNNKIYAHFTVIDTSRNYIFKKEYKMRLIILILKDVKM